MSLALRFDDNGLVQFREAVESIGNRKTAERAYRKVINKTGTKLRRGVLKTLPMQTGLPTPYNQEGSGEAQEGEREL